MYIRSLRAANNYKWSSSLSSLPILIIITIIIIIRTKLGNIDEIRIRLNSPNYRIATNITVEQPGIFIIIFTRARRIYHFKSKTFNKITIIIIMMITIIADLSFLPLGCSFIPCLPNGMPHCFCDSKYISKIQSMSFYLYDTIDSISIWNRIEGES